MRSEAFTALRCVVFTVEAFGYKRCSGGIVFPTMRLSAIILKRWEHNSSSTWITPEILNREN